MTTPERPADAAKVIDNTLADWICGSQSKQVINALRDAGFCLVSRSLVEEAANYLRSVDKYVANHLEHRLRSHLPNATNGGGE